MARVKRAQHAIQQRTAKKRKQEDALLEGGFQGVSDADLSDHEMSRKVWDDVEQDYEQVPRTLKGYEEDMVEGLPIKINGKVERKLHKREVKNLKGDGKESANDSDKDDGANDTPLAKEVNADDDSEDEVNTDEQILQLKEDIADLVSKLQEEPEENFTSLTRLVKMAHSKNPNTCKFSMLALVPVFKSIIPGYRIRPLTELEKREKVSKEVAKLRQFEQALAVNYRNYVQLLGDLARTPNNESPTKVSLGLHAIQAANEIASNASHFNFRTEVFTILIRRICKPNPLADPAFSHTVGTLETILHEDDEGAISLEIVRILSKTAKTRKLAVDEAVLNILLSLDILHDYDPNTKDEDNTINLKQKKKDRVHLSKKQRKARKEMKEIEEEMRKAELAVSAEERTKNQAETLKIVFTLYLNILRGDSSKLVGSVLEGLAKYSSMVNLDMMGDFLEVMKERINDTSGDEFSSAAIRKKLLCIVTAFTLVGNSQQMKISMDLSAFVDALYTLLPHISLDPELELSYKSLRLKDPLNNGLLKPSVNVSTKSELLLKALDHIFFRTKSGSKLRATAFTKRLYICMTHTPEKTTVALLRFLDKLMTKYPEVAGLYSTEESIGNGRYFMSVADLTRSNPDAATLWENFILKNHYSSAVTKGIGSLNARYKELSK